MPADYRILGPLEARLQDRPVALGPRRHRALLVLLLIRANRFVAAERLIDELWGEDAPATAHNLVQGGVSALRKALGREAIETRGTAYALRVPPLALDLHRFERLAEEGALALAAERHDDASRALGEALELWRGPALADLTDEAAVRPVAARLDDVHLLVQERHAQAELGRDRHAEVLPELQRPWMPSLANLDGHPHRFVERAAEPVGPRNGQLAPEAVVGRGRLGAELPDSLGTRDEPEVVDVARFVVTGPAPRDRGPALDGQGLRREVVVPDLDGLARCAVRRRRAEERGAGEHGDQGFHFSTSNGS